LFRHAADKSRHAEFISPALYYCTPFMAAWLSCCHGWLAFARAPLLYCHTRLLFHKPTPRHNISLHAFIEIDYFQRFSHFVIDFISSSLLIVSSDFHGRLLKSFLRQLSWLSVMPAS
jgi:hypothetical protein